MNDNPSPSSRNEIGPFLSVSGSIASLVALAIVFVDKLADSHQIDSQFIVWRLALCFACLVAIGTAVTLVYHRIRAALEAPHLTTSHRTLRVGVLAVIGVFATAFFIDGLFASIYQRWWLGDLVERIGVPSGTDGATAFALIRAQEQAAAAKAIGTRTVNIFFSDDRSADALGAKSTLERLGARVGLIASRPGAIQPNTVYYRNVDLLEAALAIEKLLSPIGVHSRSVATWRTPSADVIVWIQ